MKIRYFLMFGLLLAVLTIGAVSATENMTFNDNLADGQEIIVSQQDDAIIEQVDNDLTENDEDSSLSEGDISIEVYPNRTWGDSDDDAYVAEITTSRENGNITVLIDDVEKFNRELEYGRMDISFYNLNINCGEYNMKINYVNQTTTQALYDGPLKLTYNIDVNDETFDMYSDLIYYYEPAWNFGVTLPRDATGTLTISFNGNSKQLAYNKGRAESSISIDGLSIGEHKIKVSLTDDAKFPDKTIEYSFYVIPEIDVPYYVAVGEIEYITIELPKSYKGTVTAYKGTFDEFEGFMVDQEIGSASVVNGLAKIPVKNLVLGRNYIAINCTGDGNYFDDEYNVINYIENSQRFSSSVVSSVIDVGGDVVIKITAPKSSYGLEIYVDGKDFKEIPLDGGEITEYISGLSIGEHKIKLQFSSSSESYSNSFYISVKDKSSAPTPSPAPAKKDTIKLTLKKVAVKKSAKKLVLQATLKINGKAVKGKIIKFKFNKKTYNVKTNKKGVAKLTIKKSVLKKLKKSKKIAYTATYDKTTKKVTVKVKK